MASYRGASASGKEIIMILAFMAGLIIVFYMLVKRETESAISGVTNAISKVVTDTTQAVTAPVRNYMTNLEKQKAEWDARVASGQIPADEPIVHIPIIGEKEVYSVPSGGQTIYGSGEKEEDFVDIGYGVLVPKHVYLYNLKVW